MTKFDVVEEVFGNEEIGGRMIVRVCENDVERDVELCFDFGESLCTVELVDGDETIESVFSDEVVEKLWNMDFAF